MGAAGALAGRGPRLALALAVAAALCLGAALARAAEVTRQGNLQVAVAAKMRPQALPRTGAAPIAVSVGGHITTTDGTYPPQLQTLTIEINRQGRLEYAGLPLCPLAKIKLASTEHALSACHSSLVGQGTFYSNIVLKGEPPYPSKGRLLVFNGREGSHQVLFGHIYVLQPFATSFVITFQIKNAHGTYGTALIADVAKALGNWGYLTGIEMTLSRRYTYHGARRSYLSAGCPAPKGFPSVNFPLARTSFRFPHNTLTSTLVRRCDVRS